MLERLSEYRTSWNVREYSSELLSTRSEDAPRDAIRSSSLMKVDPAQCSVVSVTGECLIEGVVVVGGSWLFHRSHWADSERGCSWLRGRRGVQSHRMLCHTHWWLKLEMFSSSFSLLQYFVFMISLLKSWRPLCPLIWRQHYMSSAGGPPPCSSMASDMGML